MLTATRPPNAQAKSGWARGDTQIASVTARTLSGRTAPTGGESRYRRTNGTDRITTATASTRYPLAVPVITTASSTRPTSRPAACGPKIAPEMTPRWATGTWSATAANSPADAIEKPSEANIQQIITPAQERCGPSRAIATASTMTPAAIHT